MLTHPTRFKTASNIDEIDLNKPFTVMHGVILLEGKNNLFIPKGGTWPGRDNLPEDMEYLIQSHTISTLGDYEISTYSTPERIEAGKALVFAILMRTLPVMQRIPLASELTEMIDSNREIAGKILGLSRERYIKLLTRFRTPNIKDLKELLGMRHSRAQDFMETTRERMKKLDLRDEVKDSAGHAARKQPKISAPIKPDLTLPAVNLPIADGSDSLYPTLPMPTLRPGSRPPAPEMSSQVNAYLKNLGQNTKFTDAQPVSLAHVR